MELFYAQNILLEDDILTFSPEESRHLIKVLRKKFGDLIRVTDGKGLEWIGQIIDINTKKVIGKKSQFILHKNNMAPLHIAIAPTKNNDRFEWFLEKATEIGVSEITPIICNHSERKAIKPNRLNKILINGIKQSAQFFLPILNPIISFEAFIKKDLPKIKLMAHCQKGNKLLLQQVRNLDNEVLIMIGPEGDFSRIEIENAQNQYFTEVSLGSQRLRTETAGLVACSKVATLREIL